MSDLPEPLSSLDWDLRGMPYMALHIVRLFDSEFYALSTGDEFKAAVSLWAKSFLQVPPGSLPNNEKMLAHYSGAGKDWPKVRAMAMHGWVLCSDERVYHPVVVEVARDAWEKRQTHRESLAAARDALAQKRAAAKNVGGGSGSPPNGSETDTATHTASVTVAVTDTVYATDPATRAATVTETASVTGLKGWEGKGREGNLSKKDISLASQARPTGVGRAPDLDRDFDDFWQAYPRKVAKGAARRVWRRAIAKTNLDAMLRAIASQRWDEDERYQPHPATWLNGERWLDQSDAFDPVLRAAGLSPEDFDEANIPAGLLQ